MLIRFTKIHRTLGLIVAVLSITACGTNPPQDSSPQDSESLNDALFSRAKTAFLNNEYKTTAILLEPLATKGNAKAQYTLGYLYYHGKGVKQDIKQAQNWFIKSADQDNPKAIRALALLKAAINKNETPKKIIPVEKTSTPPLLDLRQTVKQQPPVQPVVQQPTTNIIQPEQLQLSVEQKALPQSIPAELTSTTTQQQNKHSSTVDTVTEGSEWIIIQPARNFTIQLASSLKEKAIIKFVNNVALDGVYYFKSIVEGVTRYTVIHGNFGSYERAKLKLTRLKERGFKNAWIRKIGKLQVLINNQ